MHNSTWYQNASQKQHVAAYEILFQTLQCVAAELAVYVYYSQRKEFLKVQFWLLCNRFQPAGSLQALSVIEKLQLLPL